MEIMVKLSVSVNPDMRYQTSILISSEINDNSSCTARSYDFCAGPTVTTTVGNYGAKIQLPTHTSLSVSMFLVLARSIFCSTLLTLMEKERKGKRKTL